ncbi:MAG TPA: plastocyanin/azurin family copper-binding protein [Nitrosarchaeum sp.]|nr:plastocyanin/azurin family copper-binding protein [Nitrosarchaeum sp.]
MANIDKAAIAFSIAIVAVGVGFAFYAGYTQDNVPAVSAPVVTKTVPTAAPSTQFGEDIAAKVKEGTPTKVLKAGWERITSATDPGVGHETHQLAIILAPSDKVYSGTLQYDASEPIQLVTLTGPLKEGEDKGQATWTPDGKTKFALTFVDPKNAAGEWKFAGNALAVHTMKTTPFTVDYKVDYKENPTSKTVMTGTIQSVQDPGMGHESHQLAVILAPSSDMYSGILSYSASENIQLVSLRGPISADEKPAQTWTPDGKTIFELTFVDPKNAMGSWEFKGNALAVHTMNTNTFTVSYSVSATATVKAAEVKMETKPSEPKTVSVTIPAGTSSPGCETTNECYTPASVTINVGDTVEWDNVDTAAHTVTGGSPADGPSGVFDSSLVMGKAKYSHTFDKAGSYDYFCMVHPWMVGNVKVN